MTIKFKLCPDPTFVAPVLIPVHGAAAVPVNFTFKYRTRAEFMAFTEKMKDLDNVQLLLAIASGWELAEPFDEEHLKQLDEHYMGAAKAALDVYIEQNAQSRLGN